MARQMVDPSRLDLESPGRRDYWVALPHDSIWGEWLIPLTVWVGSRAQEGEGLVAFGSTHGDEYEGPVALKHLLRAIDGSTVTGRVVLVPVLNPPAFRSGRRESVGADGVNLNRAFVDEAGRSEALAGITHRIADFVRTSIWPHVHVVIDLHAGGDVARFAALTSFHRVPDAHQAASMLEMARWFGVPFILTYQDRTPGLLTSDAERAGKISVGGEFGWGAAVSPDGIRYARHGVVAAAVLAGQMNVGIDRIAHHAAGTQQVVEAVDGECYVPAPWPGHYEPLLECGSGVVEGQVIGLLHDFNRIDDDPWQVRAGVEGYLIAAAWRAPVQQGQHIAVVARCV
ncbi:MAG: succinylglutamate desuccinylase/aspartoacylase family protein [bacterium]|nr:succinylglutamate desuccinylase/aspartoacylase family protein [bacterium]MDE0289707.1 succinylglutamate desuccinylase/aspartoacylase family protein [bacterium]MDE0440162.1 succinylglutamate desuccinylase/aspartoacylase family protein [bacterium]